jgi:hypothetical protein
VSDVLGYALILSMVLTMIALLYGTGVANLAGIQETTQTNNAERAMTVLGDSFEDIHRQQAPSRAVEIQLSESSLAVAERTTFNVTISGSSTAVEMNPLVLSVGESDIVYENGAIIRGRGDSWVMTHEPPMQLSSEQVVLSMVVTTGERTARGGSNAVLVVGQRAGSSIRERRSGSPTYNVTIRTESPRAKAWKQFYESQSGTAVGNFNLSDGEVEYSFTTQRVVIRQTVIDLQLR